MIYVFYLHNDLIRILYDYDFLTGGCVLKNITRFFIFVMGLQLIGCANLGENQQVGSITGGVIGGILGSQIGGGHGRTAAIIGGSVIGSMIGGNIGNEMDQANRMRVAHALENTRLNHSRTWIDDNTGYRYTVVPNKTYHRRGELCRNYTTSILVHGEVKQAKGTACRNKAGDWIIQN